MENGHLLTPLRVFYSLWLCCVKVEDHLRFMSHLKERCVFCAYVHSMNHTCAYLTADRKIKFRMASVQSVTNEVPGFEMVTMVKASEDTVLQSGNDTCMLFQQEVHHAKYIKLSTRPPRPYRLIK